MSTDFFQRLSAPFHPLDVGMKPQTVGIYRSGSRKGQPWVMLTAYVSARAVMDRLDEVCGPGGWEDTYTIVDGGVQCRLSLTVPGKVERIIAKQDFGEAAVGHSVKSACSDALKRAAVKWGIGRYLYYLDAPRVDVRNGYPPDDAVGAIRIFSKADPRKGIPEAISGWVPFPDLPSWALPKGVGHGDGSGRPAERRGQRRPSVHEVRADNEPYIESDPAEITPKATQAQEQAPEPASAPKWEGVNKGAFFAAAQRITDGRFDYASFAAWCADPEGLAARVAPGRSFPRPSQMTQKQIDWLVEKLGDGGDNGATPPLVAAYLAYRARKESS